MFRVSDLKRLLSFLFASGNITTAYHPYIKENYEGTATYFTTLDYVFMLAVSDLNAVLEHFK